MGADYSQFLVDEPSEDGKIIIQIGDVRFDITQVVNAANEQEEPSGPDYLNGLPDKVLLRIMSDLARSDAFDLIRLGNTCRRLYDLSCSPELWIEVKVLQFTEWSQMAGLLSPRLHAGTKTVDLGQKMLRCDRLDKRKQVATNLLF